MFIIKEAKVYSFDDGTIYSFSLKYEEANQKLSHDMHIILNWSRVDSVVPNPGKYKIKFLGLATCARKPKAPGSSPAASYVQRWALCSNRPANV